MRTSKFIFFLPIISAIFILCNCSDEPAKITQPSPDEEISENPLIVNRHIFNVTPEERPLITKCHRAGQKLWNAAEQATAHDENILISTLGLQFNLFTLANFAYGQTEIQLNDLLENPELPVFNRLFNRIYIEFPKIDRNLNLSAFNSFWLQTQVSDENLNSILNIVNSQYGTDFFANTSDNQFTLTDLNKWLAKTSGKDNYNFLTSVGSIPIVLMSSTYLHSPWIMPFDTKDIKKGTFFNIDGTETTVDMMHNKTLVVKSTETDKALIILIPSSNSGFYLEISIPKDGYTLDDISWEDTYRAHVEKFTMNLTIPRFSMESTNIDFANILRNMGYSRIVDNPEIRIPTETDSNISIFQLCGFQLGNFETNYHSTHYDEIFKEDVAPWWVHYGQDYKHPVVIDKPFRFAISETNTGLRLYMGKVVKL